MIREKICGIYKVTNKTNNKVYIGQSVNIYSRWNHHKSCCFNKKCHEYHSPFYRALRKYGVENFTFEIIEQCEIDELDDKEIYYIKEYNSFIHFENSNGYNNSIGGNQGSRFRIKSEEEKRKISENRDYKTGRDNPLSRVVLYNGQKYGNVNELAQTKLIPYSSSTIKNWLNGQKSMPSIYYDNGLMYENDNKRFKRDSSFKYSKETWLDGICFNSANDCADYCGINAGTLRSYLSKARRMPKSLYDRGLRYDGEKIENYEYF